jgi:hypothetical protein
MPYPASNAANCSFTSKIAAMAQYAINTAIGYPTGLSSGAEHEQDQAKPIKKRP